MNERKTYTELIKFTSFIERYRYLKIGGEIGKDTFGFNRWLNQILYHSREWRSFRKSIIIRDLGCDLAVEGYEIFKGIIIHHINPISYRDLLDRNPCIFDPDNVVCVSHNTHEAIHYGDESLLSIMPIERKQNDTIPWKI